MIEFEKSTFGSHTIESSQVLTEVETGRVVAVFYNDYDLDEFIELQALVKKLKDQLKDQNEV